MSSSQTHALTDIISCTGVCISADVIEDACLDIVPDAGAGFSADVRCDTYSSTNVIARRTP